MDRTGIKLLWNTANMFSNPRYINGAASTNNADVFAYAAAQVKRIGYFEKTWWRKLCVLGRS